jgi:hypothetical protein
MSNESVPPRGNDAPNGSSNGNSKEGETISSAGYVVGPDGVVYKSPHTPEEAEKLRGDWKEQK